MLTIRPSQKRGHFDHGWLKTYHTFSFADYYDVNNMGFRQLRVINEDWVKSAEGFGRHPHRDMEIITYVVEGALEHKDSLGTGSVIKKGEVQVMTAGTGVSHSEFNHSKKEDVHLLQIWILPDQKGHEPRYQQKSFNVHQQPGRLHLLVTGDGRETSLQIHQDVQLWACCLEEGQSLAYNFKNGRYGWLQVITGSLTINELVVGPGDGVAISDEANVAIGAQKNGEFLFFDLN